ncbi:hypothetical protein GVN21_13570 [Caulobacter sp. SLTY]|uniref:hypothetical protein n=1 Tax=Caulobacter sp. SLTY TaxID=2683262 RepID=UPI00141230D0|nr:hypothetical protein [Caulobacter sp. SLTY]NBB16389.1 hypothetical protein [Caulobacter sp. SLTY]
MVVPAEVAGIAGDYLIDPSAPTTLIHETRAQTEGFAAVDLVAAVRIDGLRIKALPVKVADLDGRAPGFDTPIAGVIGADVLAGQVVDLDFKPCRVSIQPRSATRLGGRTLPLVMVGGTPTVRASASDDRRARSGLFAIDWSSAGLVRLNDRIAALKPPRDALDPLARNAAPARLRALSVADALYEEAEAGLIAGLDPALTGSLGADFWSRWRVRLDMRRGVVVLFPKT